MYYPTIIICSMGVPKLYIWYYPYTTRMGSLQKKRKKGNDYWYWMRTERVDGQPRVTQQVYLGSADRIRDIVQAYKALPRTPLKSYSFGLAAALLSAADDLGLLEAVEEAAGKERHHGLSTGQYLTLMVAGRCGRPMSKLKISEVFDSSYLKLLWNIKGSISCQNILDHMDRLDEDAMERIEDRVTAVLIDRGISPERLIFDTTNMVTHIENGGELPHKGPSKERRYDKNLIGLALAVGSGSVPLLHQTLPGNSSDINVFPSVVEGIRARLKRAGADAGKLILIVDRGNNSKKNFQGLPEGYQLVGSLKRNQVNELMELPLDEYELLYKNGKKNEILGYRSTGTHFGMEWTVVVQYNDATKRKRTRTYEREISRSLKRLGKIEKQLKKPPGRGRPLSKQGLMKKIVKALPENHSLAIHWETEEWKEEINGRERERFSLTFSVNKKKDKYYRRGFGKTAVFTDCHDWSSEEIVRTYNSKYLVEDDFRWLKDRFLVCITPVYHRRDDRIRVHVFSCVMGLVLVRYTAWKLRDLGLSPRKMFEKLEGIRVSLVQDNGTKQTTFVVEQMDGVQSTMFARLGLDRYIIK